MSLSDKQLDRSRLIPEVNNLDEFFYKNDVREAVKELKEKIIDFYRFTGSINHLNVNHYVDEIFGDKLI